MGRHVALSEDEFACDAVDAVRTNDSIRCCSCAVLEVENHAAAFFVLDGLEALVKVRTFSGQSLDEFVEEVSAVYALHTAWSLLRTDHFIFMFAFALVERDRISIFEKHTKYHAWTAEDFTYDNVFYEIIGVRFPHVWCRMLLESVPSMGSYEFESALGI